MTEPHVAFAEIEDGVARFIRYRDEGPRKVLEYPIDELPEGIQRDDRGKHFRPEFDDSGEIVALHYDEELTEQEHERAQSTIEQFKQRLDDTE